MEQFKRAIRAGYGPAYSVSRRKPAKPLNVPVSDDHCHQCSRQGTVWWYHRFLCDQCWGLLRDEYSRSEYYEPEAGDE